jgi:AcrR family transcriptional regulator
LEYFNGSSVPDILASLDLPRVPQQERSRLKRDALLIAAADLFAQRGYEATTADDIAAAAAVSIGTFYSYFRNKRQVFLTLYAACVESLLALGITEIDFETDPRAAIGETVRRALQRDPVFYGLRRAWSELLPRDPEIALYNDQINHLIYNQILTVVRRVAARGLTRPDLDVEPTCWMITMLLDQMWHVLPGPQETSQADVERHQDALAAIIYHALFRTL